MNVLVCIPCLMTGGTEIQTLSLVKAIVAAGHQPVTVCYFEHSDAMAQRYSEAGSEVVLLSPDGRRPQGVRRQVTSLYRGLRWVVKQYRPDVALDYNHVNAGHLSKIQWLKDFLKRGCQLNWNWRDPMPTIAYYRSKVISRISKTQKIKCIGLNVF